MVAQMVRKFSAIYRTEACLLCSQDVLNSIRIASCVSQVVCQCHIRRMLWNIETTVYLNELRCLRSGGLLPEAITLNDTVHRDITNGLDLQPSECR
jgi:hypothetical protein